MTNSEVFESNYLVNFLILWFNGSIVQLFKKNYMTNKMASTPEYEHPNDKIF